MKTITLDGPPYGDVSKQTGDCCWLKLGVTATFTHGSSVHAAAFYLRIRDWMFPCQTTYHGFHYAAAGVDSSLLLSRWPDLDFGWRGGQPQRERRQHRPELWLLRDSGGKLPAGVRRRGAAAERCKCQGEIPDPERQHGLHGAADTHPHGTSGQETLQNRDAAPGVQLYRALGKRAGGRGREGGRPAVPQCGLQGGEGEWRRKTAPDYLHILPQQPTERGKTLRHATQKNTGRCHEYEPKLHFKSL